MDTCHLVDSDGFGGGAGDLVTVRGHGDGGAARRTGDGGGQRHDHDYVVGQQRGGRRRSWRVDDDRAGGREKGRGNDSARFTAGTAFGGRMRGGDGRLVRGACPLHPGLDGGGEGGAGTGIGILFDCQPADAVSKRGHGAGCGFAGDQGYENADVD